MKSKLFVFLSCVILLTSCFEIEDTVIIGKMGNGAYSRTISMNYGQEVTGLNLDSIMQIELALIKSTPGISMAELLTIEKGKAYKLNFDFMNVESLNKVFVTQEKKEDNSRNPVYFAWKTGNFTFHGGVPGLASMLIKEEDGISNIFLEDAKYTLNFQAPKKIKKFNNTAYSKVTKSNLTYGVKFGTLLNAPKANSVTISYK